VILVRQVLWSIELLPVLVCYMVLLASCVYAFACYFVPGLFLAWLCSVIVYAGSDIWTDTTPDMLIGSTGLVWYMELLFCWLNLWLAFLLSFLVLLPYLLLWPLYADTTLFLGLFGYEACTWLISLSVNYVLNCTCALTVLNLVRGEFWMWLGWHLLGMKFGLHDLLNCPK
jgi:hypothetical protein